MDKLIPLEFDRNGNMKYWIDTNDYLYGFSLWRYESIKETSCSKLITNIPVRFRKTFYTLKNDFKNEHKNELEENK